DGRGERAGRGESTVQSERDVRGRRERERGLANGAGAGRRQTAIASVAQRDGLDTVETAGRRIDQVVADDHQAGVDPLNVCAVGEVRVVADVVRCEMDAAS